MSEHEKVDEITSYERLNAFFDVFACLPGFTWSLRPFFGVGDIAHVFG